MRFSRTVNRALLGAASTVSLRMERRLRPPDPCTATALAPHRATVRNDADHVLERTYEPPIRTLLRPSLCSRSIAPPFRAHASPARAEQRKAAALSMFEYLRRRIRWRVRVTGFL